MTLLTVQEVADALRLSEGGCLMLTRFDNPTFGQMIAACAPLRMVGTPTTLSQLQAFRTAEEKALGAAAEMRQMMTSLGEDRPWQLPTTVVPAEIGMIDHEEIRPELQTRHQELLERIEKYFLRDLESAAHANRIGRIEWLGDRCCRFNYFDTERSRSLTRLRTRTMNHTHDLICAKRVRLPAHSVKKPRRCSEIIRAMPLWMQKHSYIVVGTQIAANIELVAQADEPNELALAARWAGQKLQQGGKEAARAPARVADAASRLVKTMTKILPDPALVIADYVLFGWEG
jgi:hypothetical protein